MPGTRILLGALVGAFALFGVPQPSHAQILAVWASRSGANTNDCTTPTTPCRSIGSSGALSKVDPGGTIHVLPGTYGSVFIDKSVQIVVDDGEPEVSGVVTSLGDVNAAFIVNAGGNDDVRIRGMIVNPTGQGSAIALVPGRSLHVENCTLIASNERSAIDFAPTGASELYVSNSKIAENGTGSAGSGILIRPTGSGSAKAVIENVSVENNTLGINIEGTATSGAISVVVRNTTMSANTVFGIKAIESGAGSTNVMLESSTSSNNGTNGVLAVGANAIIRMRNSTVTGNAGGLVVSGGGQLVSHGGNVVAGKYHQRLVHWLVRAAIATRNPATRPATMMSNSW